MVPILYEDNHLLICVKPVGILSQPGLGEGEDMLTLLTEYRMGKKEDRYIGLVHRLDRNVGGVMVFSKNKSITAKLSEAIRNREFIKEYMTVVHHHPEEKSGVYEDLLFKDSSKNKSYVVNRMRKGVKEASLEYETLGTKDSPIGELSLIRVHLHTGRTHQIRVQFASRKLPLVGDGKYGSRDNGCNIALWSYRLAFRHPVKKKDIDIKQFPSNEYPWNLFTAD